MSLLRLYGLNESSRPTMFDGQLDGTEQDAANLLKRAVSSGREVPQNNARPNVRIWHIGTHYVGASFHEGGWCLIWTAPVNTQRVSIDQKSGIAGSQQIGVLDPHGDEVDDYAVTVNWVDPQTADSILNDSN
ncbi:MAG TPA: hypothetical protein VFT74_18980 [Isosphaeraceae bacterium]|nr:hypothetical protein [Isosphaeraceae bacterium]